MHVYKFFSEKEYSERLIRGNIRFTNVLYYRDNKGVRGDPDEGVTRYSQSNSDGSITFMGETSLAGIFIFSTCGQDCSIDLMKKRFGNYVVKIMNVDLFISLIKGCCVNLFPTINIDLSIQGKQVTYAENGNYDKELNWCLKHNSFSDEKEFRFAIFLPPISNKDTYLYLDIGKQNLDGLFEMI